jgi:hypothetical protein
MSQPCDYGNIIVYRLLRYHNVPLEPMMTYPNVSNLMVVKYLNSLNMMKPCDRVTRDKDLHMTIH